MEKINFSNGQAIQFVKVALVELGYNEDAQVQFIRNEEHIEYNVWDSIFYDGEKVKKLTVLNFSTFVELLKMGLEMKGYDIHLVRPCIRENSITFKVEAYIVRNNKGHSLKKRNK